MSALSLPSILVSTYNSEVETSTDDVVYNSHGRKNAVKF